MRKALIVTAAIPAAVIFFVLATLPPRPRAVAASDLELARRTVAGAYHVHTLRSDGSGDRAAVAAAAARAGLRFVIATDHGDATRQPEAPAYISGVLCLDGVEVSTTGGHYVALGLGAAPYPLGGEAAAVIEDVARLGGFGIAAHPNSARPELAWMAWDAPFDGIEWINADSEWRNETRARLARVLLAYPFRPAAALASILDRPVNTIERWDALTRTRPVLAIAGDDAHGGVGRSAEYRGTTTRPFWTPGIPSYEASFRTFSTNVVLPRPLTGDAAADAAALLDAVRRGAVFTAVNALATPALLDVRATRGSTTVTMGETLTPGPVTIVASAPGPPGARMVLLHDGAEVAAASGGALRAEVAEASGAYRIEVHVPGAAGIPPVPWLFGNPVYFLPPPAAPVVPAMAAAVPLPADISWHVEKDRGSTASIVPGQSEVDFFYKLRGPGRGSQYAAAVADLQGRTLSGGAIALTVTAVRPARLSLQLRYRGDGGARWGRSLYVDATPREIRIPLASLIPADRQLGPAPPLARATSLMLVADLTNALPGAANTIRISGAGLVP